MQSHLNSKNLIVAIVSMVFLCAICVSLVSAQNPGNSPFEPYVPGEFDDWTSSLGRTFLLSAGGQSRTYTTDADFEEGTLNGVQHDTVHDQLQLSLETTTLPVMWIANAGEDSLSKWDIKLNKEVGRYHTWFGAVAPHGAFTGPAPSRTAVDLDGNGYVANRHFDNRPATVFKILNGSFIDRNGNGVEDTSFDADASSSIEPSEMLPITDLNNDGIIQDSEVVDERIAWVTHVGPNGGIGRSLAIAVALGTDGGGNTIVYLGSFGGSRSYIQYDSGTGTFSAPGAGQQYNGFGVSADGAGT